jgi:GGDEF domain-containing protein
MLFGVFFTGMYWEVVLMQLRLMCQGELIDCQQKSDNCETLMCSRELMLKVLKSLVRPHLMPVIHRVFEVQELFLLADIVCLGENQLYHVIRMCDYVFRLKDSYLNQLGLVKEDIMTAILFHDCGKGREVDDSIFRSDRVSRVKVPRRLKNYGVPAWAEYFSPAHDHIELGLNIAQTYNLPDNIMEALALHHHVKILPEVLDTMVKGLCLPNVIREDVLQQKTKQYVAKGSILSQAVAVLDQVCAIERKFEGRISLAQEAEKIEDELVKDLVIGLTDANDLRVGLLGNNLDGNETVIMFDLRNFGEFVQQNTEYKVQATKKEVLNTIRSVVRGQSDHREKDMVGLVGGDEFAVVTKVKDFCVIEKVIGRIDAAIKNRTGLNVRCGYNIGEGIEANFHEARRKAQIKKEF